MGISAILEKRVKPPKLDKNLLYQILFIAGLVVFTVIALNLSVGWFTIVMPIFAALILFLIFQVKD